jgi:hypothetical protein
MNMPDWKEVLPSPPLGGNLLEAWMTTFDHPDPGLLVEHLLPSLLGMTYTLTQNLDEKNQFFGDLATSLERLRGRISIISSPPREIGQGLYPWLGRYVDHFHVGSKEHAVQHSKLWVFHWQTETEELLELHVSSTNLTTSAFKHQLQAGYQLRLPIQEKQETNVNNKKTWSELIPFLNKLGKSAGSEASERIQRLDNLLGRVACPNEITFVASIPGDGEEPSSAWRSLKETKPSEIHILAPTIGEWDSTRLSQWCKDIGIDPKAIRLKWISESHPWSTQGWALTKTTWQILNQSKVNIDCIPDEARFIDQHHEGDLRWSHAKLYLILSCNKKKRQLLITSANWSLSAWGSSNIPPKNFELGVLFETDWQVLETYRSKFNSDNAKPFLVERSKDETGDRLLQWGEASWDGKEINIMARSKDNKNAIEVKVTFENGQTKNIQLVNGKGLMIWTETIPLIARFTQADEELEVYIRDLRPPSDFAKSPLPEVDPAVENKLREALLLQRYGGPAVECLRASANKNNKKKPQATRHAANYAVQYWIDARAAFMVVDNWSNALNVANGLLIEQIRMDGEKLKELYSKRGKIYEAVADELSWRTKRGD